MKFFHLSDLHIGLKLCNRDLTEDQEHIFGQIAGYARREKPDAIVIAGDIYDKAVPSAEAVTLFDHFLSELTEAAPGAAIMMISGNHDSAPRVNVFRHVLSRQNVYMVGLAPAGPDDHIEKVTLGDAFGRVNFYLLPFVRPSMVRQVIGAQENGNSFSYDDTIHKLIAREEIDPADRNVLVSHQFYLPVGKDADQIERMDSEIRTVGNIDEVRADVLGAFDYAALGHIHKPMAVGGEAYRYCGTPLACSVSEQGQQKGIILAEMRGKGDLTTTLLPLTPLRQVRVIKGILEEVLEQGCGDLVAVVLTDQDDLDVIDMQDRIRSAFPNLLEIRRETLWKADHSRHFTAPAALDPLELCLSFLGECDGPEQELLRDVIHTVQEVD